MTQEGGRTRLRSVLQAGIFFSVGSVVMKPKTAHVGSIGLKKLAFLMVGGVSCRVPSHQVPALRPGQTQ